MKRLVILSILFLMFNLCFIIAAEDGVTEQEQVNEAYACMEDRVADSCSALTAEERAFSLLTIEECQDEIEADKITDTATGYEYWSDSDGKGLKITALTTLAMASQSEGTNASESWLLAQSKSPTSIFWYLELDAPVEEDQVVTCTVDYAGTPYTVKINYDKTLTLSTGGSCLQLASGLGNYYLGIKESVPQCLDYEYTISCDANFLTTLLFKESDPNEKTLHISKDSHSGSAGATTVEKN